MTGMQKKSYIINEEVLAKENGLNASGGQ